MALSDILSELLGGGTSMADLPAPGATEAIGYGGGAPSPLASYLPSGGGPDYGNAAGSFLGALGPAIIAGNRYNPVDGRTLAYGLQQAGRDADLRTNRASLRAILKSSYPNLSDAQLDAASANPEAAKMLLSAEALKAQTAAGADANSFMSGLLSGGSNAGAGGRLPSMAGGGQAMKMPTGDTAAVQGQFADALKAGGLTNPYGLGAMVAYGQHESGYDPNKVMATWSDPSQSGQPGTSGGILSWRGQRLANMQASTQGAKDPVTAQAAFALNENPALTQALQNAKSPEEANRLMADAWRFAGFDQRGGGEFAKRLATTRAYASRFGADGGGGRTQVAEADTGSPPPGMASDAAHADTRPAWARPVGNEPGAYGMPAGPGGGAGPGSAPTRLAQADLPAQGAATADVPASGSAPVQGYFIPPGRSGDAPRTVPADGSGAPITVNGKTYQGRTADYMRSKGAVDDSAGTSAGSLPRSGTVDVPAQTFLTNPTLAQQALPQIIAKLGNPNLPDTARKSLEWMRDQAFAATKPSDRSRQLQEQGFVPGTPEYKQAYNDQFVAKPATGFRSTPDGNQEFIPGSSADPDYQSKLATAKASTNTRVQDQANQRKELAQELNLQPGTPAYNNYIANGTLPDPSNPKPMVMKSITDSDAKLDKLYHSRDALAHILALNDDTPGGKSVWWQQQAQSNLPNSVLPDSVIKGAVNATEFDKTVQEQMLPMLKEYFGGRPAFAADQQMLKITPTTEMSPQMRKPLLDRMAARVDQLIQEEEQKNTSLRDGNYFRPGNSPSSRTQGAPQQSQGATQAAPRQAVPQAQPGASAASRFNDLIGRGMTKQDAYQQLQREGY